MQTDWKGRKGRFPIHHYIFDSTGCVWIPSLSSVEWKILNVTQQLFRALIARRAMYMKPLFWQALETRANVYENPRQTIDKTNDAVMKSERNALDRVSDPP